MNLLSRLNYSWVFIALLIAFSSCNHFQKTQPPAEPSVENTLKLLEWFEENGNYINSTNIPSIIDAENVYPILGDSVLVVDVRPEVEYNKGHIETSINLQTSEVLQFLRETINPANFKNIIIVCNNGNISGHVAATLRFLGFENVYSMRFGLSGWDKKIAEIYWLANTSNHLIGKLDHTGYFMRPEGELPAIQALSNQGEQIAFERAKAIIDEDPQDYIITIEEFQNNLDDFYTICYWPLDKYINNGHFPRSVHYEPKKSLTLDTYLNTLPTEKPIVLYCYSGQHTTFVAAYLRMLGYDAKSLAYGANGFIHEVMAQTEARPSRTYTEKLIRHYPLVKPQKKWLLIPE